MPDVLFHVPTRVVFGLDTVNRIAQVVAGDAKAQATLRSVGGSDGTADLARLWSLYAKRKS